MSAASGDRITVPFEDDATSYDGSELTEIGSDAGLRVALVRTLLFGGSASVDLRAQLTSFGLESDLDYVAFRAHPRPGHGLAQLALELGGAGSARVENGVSAAVGGDMVGFLAIPPACARTGIVGIGPLARPDHLAESFQLASRALAVAQAFGLSGVHSFDELGLLPTILADVDVGESLRRRYLRPFDAVDSPEILLAVRAYFAHGMQVGLAATAISVHPNTLRNRIRRFEKVTETDLREPAVAMEVWWALQRDVLANRAVDDRRAEAKPTNEMTRRARSAPAGGEQRTGLQDGPPMGEVSARDAGIRGPTR